MQVVQRIQKIQQHLQPEPTKGSAFKLTGSILFYGNFITDSHKIFCYSNGESNFVFY
jgi:hypothetical protein